MGDFFGAGWKIIRQEGKSIGAISPKKGANFLCANLPCQCALAAGGVRWRKHNLNRERKMNHLKLLVALGVMAACLGVVSTTGCTTRYQKVTQPDGSIVEVWEFEFHPNLVPNLLNYDIELYGFSDQGLPIRRLTPKQTGEILYEMEGGYYTLKDVRPRLQLNTLEVESQIDSDESEFFQESEYRISTDYFADSAVLEGQLAGTDSWQVVSSGDLETVAAAAMRLGLGAMEFENEFGAWSIQVDSPIPAVVTRLNGEIIDVRGVHQPIKPLMDTSMHERCR